MAVINYVSELTGTGKTGKLLDKISRDTEQYIIAVPNRSLCTEIHTRLIDRGATDEIQIINMDTQDTPSRVLSEVLKSPKDTRIIITTHTSFELAMDDTLFESIKNKWSFIIDEELTFYKTHEFNVSELSKAIIEDTVSVKAFNRDFYEIVPTCGELWDDVRDGVCEETFLNHPDYVSFVKYAKSGYYTSLVPKTLYDNFIREKTDLGNNKFKKFYAISICNEKFFDTFKHTTILSSFFEYTISYKLMGWMGLSLNKLTLFEAPKTHPNSSLITLTYYCESNWSNIHKNKKVIDDGYHLTLEEYVKQSILMDLDGKDFIYNTNVNFRKGFGKGILVTSVHGVNKYINYTNMVFMPSLNATASLVNILSYFDISRKEVDFSRNVLQAYQFVSRGVVRKVNNEEEANIYIMDHRTMEFLGKLYPHATIKFKNCDSLVKMNTRKPERIPNNVRSFMSRVKRRLNDGDTIRSSTITKYEKLIEQYY